MPPRKRSHTTATTAASALDALPRHVLQARVLDLLSDHNLRSWSETHRAGRAEARSILLSRPTRKQELGDVMSAIRSALTRSRGTRWALSVFKEMIDTLPPEQFKVTKSTLQGTLYRATINTPRFSTALTARTGPNGMFGLSVRVTLAPAHALVATHVHAPGLRPVVELEAVGGFPLPLTKVVASKLLGLRRSPRNAR